ncbi:hypothetical protein L596_008952 [Steinernema carpocapsae]|uniref:Uncharacterized protein n=1 Tax=Steinernema carpocapsae TaxID=34508 RepID=A0A4U5PF38_STECR|nr:hypothetical protein L596_008952 [Steinernema carpocapsae]
MQLVESVTVCRMNSGFAFFFFAALALASASPNCDCNALTSAQLKLTNEMGEALEMCQILNCRDEHIAPALDYAGNIAKKMIYGDICKPTNQVFKNEWLCPMLNTQIIQFNNGVKAFYEGAKEICRCGCKMPEISSEFLRRCADWVLAQA